MSQFVPEVLQNRFFLLHWQTQESSGFSLRHSGRQDTLYCSVVAVKLYDLSLLFPCSPCQLSWTARWFRPRRLTWFWRDSGLVPVTQSRSGPEPWPATASTAGRCSSKRWLMVSVSVWASFFYIIFKFNPKFNIKLKHWSGRLTSDFCVRADEYKSELGQQLSLIAGSLVGGVCIVSLVAIAIICSRYWCTFTQKLLKNNCMVSYCFIIV